MTKLKKMILLGAMVLMMGATTVTAFAASSTTPDGISITNLDELKAQRLELRKEILAEKVEAGLLTQEQADAMIVQMEKNQTICDGTGGYGTGRMMGNGSGMMGGGFGNNGQGGRGLGQGSCLNLNQTQ